MFLYKEKRESYMDEVVARIMDSEKWPTIELPENLELLNEMADESFSTYTFSGMLAAVLMYHQLIEAMCLHLLEDCHFLIQLSVYPSTIQFSIPKNKMLGIYLSELKATVSFDNKEEFLEKAISFNKTRNDVIHEMRRSNLEDVSKSLQQAKEKFDQIYDLYDEIQDYFRVVFHGYRKDVFMDEYMDEYDEGE